MSTLRRLLQKPSGKLFAGIICAAVLILGVGSVFSDKEADSAASRLIFGSAWTAALFSFLLFGAMAGLLAILVSFFPGGAPREWPQARKLGKAKFVLKALIFVDLPAIALICFNFLGDASEIQIPYAEYVRNLVVLCLAITGLTVFVSIHFWNDNERRYKSGTKDEDLE